jgi:prepilin-type N-terminal cleavage/methylation domain-containing protein
MTAASRPGSTLIELLIVLAILGVLASVVPPVVSLDGPRVEQPADVPRRLRANAIGMHRAQRAAVRTGAGVGLVRAEPSGLVLVDSAGQTRLATSRETR